MIKTNKQKKIIIYNLTIITIKIFKISMRVIILIQKGYLVQTQIPQEVKIIVFSNINYINLKSILII